LYRFLYLIAIQKVISLHKIFPNTEAYLVFYDPGAGGNFIRNLIANLYYQNQFSTSDSGAAHFIEYPRNITKESLERYVMHMGNNIGGMELVLEPEDENLPIILNSHNHEFNYNSYFRKFPKGKIIFVTCESCDIPRLSVNQFFKIIDQFYSFGKPDGKPKRQLMWANCRKRFSVLSNKQSPKDCSKEELSSIFLDCKDKPIFPKNFNEAFMSKLYLNKNKYLTIPYKKLINDPKWVMEELSVFLNKPLNDHSKENYKKYLDAQNNLLNDYAPWILESTVFT
jgi:hypothetical protein